MEYKNIPRQNTRYPQWSLKFFPAQTEEASPVEFGESSPVDFGRLSLAKLKRLSPIESKILSPIESKRLSPVKSQLKRSSQRSSFLSQIETQSPTGFSIASNGNLPPAEFISGILSRACPPHRVISSSVYSPAELSSPAGLFSQSSSFTIPSGNEEFNSFLQQQSGIYFP